MKVTSSGEFVSPRRHRSFIYNLTTMPPPIATCRDRTQKKQLMSSPSGVLGLTAEQGDDYGYGEPVPLKTFYRRLDPKEHPHPLNNPDISYGMYNSGVPQSRKCCIVENFSKTWVSSHSDFASHMQKNRFPNLCLEVYAYDEPNGKLICEPFKSTLMSWTEQLLESRNLDCWKDEDDIISGKSLLRPLFGFLMVYAPEGHYHPDLLNSVYITDENKVKFLSKVEVLRRRWAWKKNLYEVVSFIYGISTGVAPQNLKRIGNLNFPVLLPKDLAHIPKSLWNLYKYLQSYEPRRHPACFFFDPPFLHGWPDRVHYVYHVHMEVFGYNPSIKKIFRNIINWDSWEKSLSEVNDVLKEYEDFRNSKIAGGSSDMFYKPHGPNEGMIKYFVNIFKHFHSDLLHTQARVPAVSSAYATNPTPVNSLESIIEKRLNVSGYVYMALNEYLKTNPGEVKEFSERILTWPRLGL